jgi:hypothetical protein
MKTKIGFAIKQWTELLYLRFSGDSPPGTCNQLVDALAELDEQCAKIERRLDAIEDRLGKLSDFKQAADQ